MTYGITFIQECWSSVKSQKGVTLFNDVSLRTRRALSLYKVYGNGALLVLNGASLNSDNALLALIRQDFCYKGKLCLLLHIKDIVLTMWRLHL